MPINPSTTTSPEGTTAFLFAHQDDEFGVFAEIESEAARGEHPVCVYLTDSAFGDQSSARRNAESLGVLSNLGVDPKDVHFLGLELGIRDGSLNGRAGEAHDGVLRVVGELGSVSRILMPAWEGGHQDHDATHLIGLAIARDMSLMPRTFQFSLYHGAGLPGRLFWVLAPLPNNGPVTTRQIPWPRRLRYLRYCLSYGSQWKSWIGLFPFVLIDYLFSGRQKLQPVDPSRVHEAPHTGKLLYERRGSCTYAEVAQCAADFAFRK